ATLCCHCMTALLLTFCDLPDHRNAFSADHCVASHCGHVHARRPAQETHPTSSNCPAFLRCNTRILQPLVTSLVSSRRRKGPQRLLKSGTAAIGCLLRCLWEVSANQVVEICLARFFVSLLIR